MSTAELFPGMNAQAIDDVARRIGTVLIPTLALVGHELAADDTVLPEVMMAAIVIAHLAGVSSSIQAMREVGIATPPAIAILGFLHLELAPVGGLS